MFLRFSRESTNSIDDKIDVLCNKTICRFGSGFVAVVLTLRRFDYEKDAFIGRQHKPTLRS